MQIPQPLHGRASRHSVSRAGQTLYVEAASRLTQLFRFAPHREPRLLKWDFDLSLQERRVLIDEMYEMLAPILFGRGVHRSSGNTVHHGELRDPDVPGWIIVSNNSTQQLIESHKLRRAKILLCAQLAEQLGAKTVGMAE